MIQKSRGTKPNLSILFLCLSITSIGISRAEEKLPTKTRVYAKDFEGWDAEPYCGTASSPLPAAFFRQGPRMEAGGGGSLVVAPDGAGYVAAGTFIYRISKKGRVELLAGTPGVSGWRDGRADRALFGGISVLRLNAKGVLHAMEQNMRCIRIILPGKENGPWVVKTLVGSPNKPAKRVDGALAEASFMNPCGMTIFDDGRIFIMDRDHLRVIHPKEDRISTLNPKGGRGYTDGPLESARFKIAFTSNCLTSDGKNTFYISDMWNNVMRKIDLAKNEISTVAGGPARGTKGSGTPKGTDPFRDGPAMWARYHPGGGVTTAYLNRDTGSVYSGIADDKPHVLSPDGWLRTVKEGLPVAFDVQGRAYLNQGGKIIRMKKLKPGEKPFKLEEAPAADTSLFKRAAFDPNTIPKDVHRHRIAVPAQAPVLDGKLDDEAWKAAKVFTLRRHNGSDGSQQSPTQIRLLADKENLYLAVRAVEPDMNGMKNSDRNHDDGRFYTDDYVELFVIPSLDPRDPAYQIMINNVGQTWDGQSKNAKSWNPKLEVKTAREADAWTVEMKMPLTEIKSASKSSQWRMNVSRYRARGPQGDRETTWSLMYTTSSHAYTRFNVVSVEALGK